MLSDDWLSRLVSAQSPEGVLRRYPVVFLQ